MSTLQLSALNVLMRVEEDPIAAAVTQNLTALGAQGVETGCARDPSRTSRTVLDAFEGLLTTKGETMSKEYPELEALVEAVRALERRRSLLRMGRAHGATGNDLQGLVRGANSAVIGVEWAAVDLATSDNLRERLDTDMEEAERRGMR